MNRIEKTFKKGKVFAAYITAGDGELSTQLSMIRALLKGGVNLLEIGVPFSDPIADGVVIQRAMERALCAHTTIFDVLNLIKAIRAESDVPIILFTYYNPILIMQKQNILQQTKSAGADGILVVDLPFFEADEHLKTCAQLELAPIAVIAPTTDAMRLKQLVTQGRGFLYYACQKGTTGVRKDLPLDVRSNILAIKKITDLPVIIGFGIADRTSSQAAIALADGFVVGSYFIQAIESGLSAEGLTQLTTAINPML
jgi:tryptophan synthase alpha chain